ncbi:MAG: flavodoxin family protein [Candidatus Omnitrophota bacterium]|nr:MAG: flavodoxin family protein [Candidatus Omnitrophota bacterium]
MKILAILGSPRRGGNSEILLDKALEGVKSLGLEPEKIVLNELKFAGCQECGGCDKTGRCIVNDDMQMIYKKLDEAEAVVLASPIFFGSLPAQVKAMIDRYQCIWVAKYVLEKKNPAPLKKGFLILVSAGSRGSFFKNAESIVRNFFAVLGAELKESFCCPNVDKKARVLEHPNCLEKAFELGKKIPRYFP